MRPFYTDREDDDRKDVAQSSSVDGEETFDRLSLQGQNIPEPRKRLTILQRLQSLFRFGVRSRGDQNRYGFRTDSGVEVFPSNKRQDLNSLIRDVGSSFTPEIRRLWDSYCSETTDSSETLKKRGDRYHDMDYMIYNDPLIAHAIDLYADETSQIDDQFNIIEVDAEDPAVVAVIQDLFKRLNINQEYIREVAYNLVAYGDSFDVVDCSETDGVSEVTPVSVYDVTDRLEFKASEEKKKNQSKDTFASIATRNSSVNNYINNIRSKGNTSPSASFSSYLLGFVVSSDTYLYPWQVLHYRLASRRSEFFPFGRPLFINLIGPYRQLKTSQNMMALGRMMKFPKTIYSVKTGDDMTTGEKWDAVNDAREEFANTGFTSKSKDGLSIGDEYWVPQGLITYEQFTNDINLGDIADVEYLRDNMLMGTGIPRGYLTVDVNDSTWSGQSGAALLQQSKPFARAVFRIQSVILEGLSSLVRTHLLLTGQFEGEFTPFSISLNYPAKEDSSDSLDLKSKTLDFATDIISSIKDVLGYEGAVSPELVRRIFSRFSFLDPSEVDALVDSFMSRQDSQDLQPYARDDYRKDSDEDYSEPDFPHERNTETTDTEEHTTEEGGESAEKSESVYRERLTSYSRSTSRQRMLEKTYREFNLKYQNRITEETIRTSIFEVYRRRGIRDLRIGKRHLYISNEMNLSIQEKEVYHFMHSLDSKKRFSEEREHSPI